MLLYGNASEHYLNVILQVYPYRLDIVHSLEPVLNWSTDHKKVQDNLCNQKTHLSPFQKDLPLLNLLNFVTDKCNIPVIACGGIGKWEHFYEALSKTKVDAVSAANIFHYVDQSVYLSKKYLYERKLNIRKPDLIEI